MFCNDNEEDDDDERMIDVLSIVVLDVVLGSNEIVPGRVVADVIIVLFGFVVATAVPNIMCRLG